MYCNWPQLNWVKEVNSTTRIQWTLTLCSDQLFMWQHVRSLHHNLKLHHIIKRQQMRWWSSGLDDWYLLWILCRFLYVLPKCFVIYSWFHLSSHLLRQRISDSQVNMLDIKNTSVLSFDIAAVGKLAWENKNRSQHTEPNLHSSGEGAYLLQCCKTTGNRNACKNKKYGW